MFFKADTMEIPDQVFEKDELRLLGMMWEMCKFPLENFVLQYNSMPPESIAVLKQTKKEAVATKKEKKAVVTNGKRSCCVKS
jgi:hypothetical protein